MNGCLSADLVRMARCVLEKVDRDVDAGTSMLHAALLASLLYETLKIELETTSRHEPAKVRVLAAAIDQCRHALSPPISLTSIVVELTAVLGLLEAGAPAMSNAASQARRPQLTVIEGGLSRAIQSTFR